MKKDLIERIPQQDVFARLVACEQDAPEEEQVILLLLEAHDGPGISPDIVALFDLEPAQLSAGYLTIGQIFVVEVYRASKYASEECKRRNANTMKARIERICEVLNVDEIIGLPQVSGLLFNDLSLL